VEFRILGPLEVWHAGSPISLGGPRHRRLLAVLLVNADQVVPTGRLIEALWGFDPPASAPAMLHVRVSELRAALRAAGAEPSGGLRHQGGGYMLDVGTDDLDARTFERSAAEAAGALAERAYDRARMCLERGLALWRGPALAELAAEPFALAECSRLEALRLQAVEHRLDADLALGRHAAIVAELAALVEAHPLRERFSAQLMLALYRSGRQGEALAAFQAAQRLLAEQLGVDPGAELRRLHTDILRQDAALDPVPRDAALDPAPPDAAPDPPPRAAGTVVGRPLGNLPSSLTTFVGRDHALVDICTRIQTDRLVTLTGVGGVGKSRMAVEAAAASRGDFPGGVWLVELAALTQPGLVAQAVAATVGVREHPHRPILDVLVDQLCAGDALVVLDNCEHVVAEVAEVADRLLRRCAGLRILATSRELLGITGEVVWPVTGLGVPPPEVTGVHAIWTADAVGLFVERATAVQPGFELSEANAAAAATICRRLDGLPLAIELAAASVPALGIEYVAAGLDDRFRLLTRGSRTALPRHKTLRAAVDWSYELLDAAERRLFDHLAVFVGGFTLEAAEAVCTTAGGASDGAADSPPDGFDGSDGQWLVAARLARLVDQSLVSIEDSTTEPCRFRMLETLRAYGLARLAERGEASALRDRHAKWVLDAVRSARRELLGPQQPAWLRRLETELGNLRAALRWSIERGDAATAVRLAGLLYPLWDEHGHYREGRQWLDLALGLDGAVPTAVRAAALDSAAGLAIIQGDLPAAALAAEEAAALSRKAGDSGGLARALTTSGLAEVYAGDTRRAMALLEESRHHARKAGDRGREGFALLFLTVATLAEGDYRRTVQLSEETEAALRPSGDPEGLAWVMVLRAGALLRLGDRLTAAALLRDGVAGFQRLNHLWGLSIGLFVAGQVADDRGDHETATALLGAAEGLRESVGAALLPLLRTWLDGVRDRARAALDPAAVERAWRRYRINPVGAAIQPAVDAALRQIDLVELAHE
jgi:predicted ATPase/DNA-binding SARP family transcriptional activator